MAVTRRGQIFAVFLLSVFSVLLIVISVSSDSWVVSLAATDAQIQDSTVRYGLFGGSLVLYNLATPTSNTLFMTCVKGACALSCKTEEDARRIEVEALANGYRPTAACVAVTDVDTSNPLSIPPVISFLLYVCVVVIVFLQLTFAVIAACLAILNATKNPTEPLFGLPGCLWANGVSATLGFVVLLVFGTYWATSGLNEHLAVSYIALGLFTAVGPGLGYSYWTIFCAVLCNIANIGLIKLRAFLLERDPPPPTIKVENHSDGTIFLY